MHLSVNIIQVVIILKTIYQSNSYPLYAWVVLFYIIPSIMYTPLFVSVILSYLHTGMYL